MEVIDLRHPLLNGFNPKTEQELADQVLARYLKVYSALVDGTAYIRFTDGDRKGAVAKVAFSDKYKVPEKPAITHNSYPSHWNREFTRRLDHCRFYCTATWEGRRNKIQVVLPSWINNIEILLDYDGPTVWELFDAKAAKAEILKNPNQKDINGNVLAVGDSVLYINARYGSRMKLEYGTIIEFAVAANSRGHNVSTIIESKAGEQSYLQYPENMVYKL